MKWLIGLLVALVFASAAGIGLWVLPLRKTGDPQRHSIELAAATKFHYVNMEGAAESAFKKAAEWYGLPAPDRYSREENEGARCPRHVPARKGQLFWCQALLEGGLVPVEMELSSSLGFFDTVKVGENQSLWRQIEVKETEEVWCYSHPASPAC
ncbi:MAG: hypothetical protein QOF85_939 [Solirubrobacterales bacterium]|jgi:hypothetical protein|nr:hypothetical protein [Solirubrobacterales bacterium]